MAMVFLAGAVFFTGCEKESNNNPSEITPQKAIFGEGSITSFEFNLLDTSTIENIVDELTEFTSSYCVLYTVNSICHVDLFTPESHDYEIYNHFPNQYFEDNGQSIELLFQHNPFSSSNEHKFDKWVTRQLNHGKIVEIKYENGVWYGVAHDCDDPYQDCL